MRYRIVEKSSSGRTYYILEFCDKILFRDPIGWVHLKDFEHLDDAKLAVDDIVETDKLRKNPKVVYEVDTDEL